MKIAEAPVWLTATIAEAYTAAAPVAKLTALVELDADEACDAALRYLSDAPASVEGQGGNDNAYRIACHLKDLGVSEPLALDFMDNLSDWNERCNPPWDRDELADVIGHAYAYGQNSAGSKSAAADFDIIDDWDDEPANDNPAPAGKLRFLSGEQLKFNGRPPRRPIVKGVVSEGDIACIFGKPGSGKSLIGPYIGWKLAQGDRAFGKRTKQGKVFYVAAEDEWGMQGRLNALQARYGDAPDFVLVGGVSNLAIKESADLKELLLAVKAQRPSLIFIDTVAIAFPGIDENTAEGMGRVVIVGRKLAKASGGAVVFIHHDTKAAGDTPRGHSVFDGALDMKLKLTRNERTGVISGVLGKNRNGALDWSPAFRIGLEDFGLDEDGDPINFAYAKEVEHREREPSATVPKSQAGALAILAEIGGEQGVSFVKWRGLCVDDVSQMSAQDDRESRSRVFRRVLQDLLTRKMIRKDGDRVWLTEGVSDFDLIEDGAFPEDST